MRGIGSVGVALAVVVALGSLGIVAAWLLGAVSTYADAVSHLFGHALGGLISATIALTWRRRALAVLMAGGLLTIGLHWTFAWRASEPATLRSRAQELKIVSLNTWHQLNDLDRLQSYLESEQADVVLLYEFGPTKLALIERLAATYPYAAGCAETWHCSVEILSKRPFVGAEAGRREKFDGPPRVSATYDIGSSTLTVVGAHLMRPIDGPDGHLSEMRRLAGIARSAPGPVIVAGDFNATWWSHSFSVFRHDSGLVHMGRFLPSWPAEARGLPQLNIDHLWVSPDIAIADVHLGPNVGSDHRPLVAILRLPADARW
ncbi:MAG: endonuclease/exonuclease/phosphatase family protein [Hyphomicrobiaceae bacterium]